MPEDKDPDITRLEILMKERMRARERRERTLRLRTALIAALACLLGLIASLYGFYDLIKGKSSSPVVYAATLEISKIRSDLTALKAEVADVTAAIAAAQKLPPDSSLTLEQAKLAAIISGVSERLSAVEAAILESPERALSLPLLRKDIVEMTRRADEYRAASKSEVDRLYAQQTWMLGGIGTVLLAIAGGAITVIFRSLPRSGRNEDEA